MTSLFLINSLILFINSILHLFYFTTLENIRVQTNTFWYSLLLKLRKEESTEIYLTEKGLSNLLHVIFEMTNLAMVTFYGHEDWNEATTNW